MHVAQPKPRDRQGRPPVIPAGLAAARTRKDTGEKKRTEKDVEVWLSSASFYPVKEQDSTSLSDMNLCKQGLLPCMPLQWAAEAPCGPSVLAE